MTGEIRDVVAELRTLIDRESDAVRRGAFADLAALGVRKAVLIEALSPMPEGVAPTDLQALRTACETNGRLLEAALDGIAAARARLAAIRQAGSRLDTYDHAGRAQRVSFAAMTVERRA